jgi:hypothetical protein
MELAEKQFGIPMVLEPEYLSSPHLVTILTIIS